MANDQIIPIVRPQQEKIQIPDVVKSQINKINKIPTEAIELPSKGHFYTEDNPLSSGKITIKHLTAKEEDILSNQSLIKKGTVLTEMLKSIIIDPYGCLDNLTIGDKNCLFFYSRIYSYGNEYISKVRCPACQKDQDVNIDLSTIKPKEYDFSKYPKGVNRFNYELPISKKVLTYKLLTSRDEDLIESELRSIEKISNKSVPDMTTRLKYMIVAVDNNEDKNVIKQFVDTELLSNDSLSFRRKFKETMPDVDTNYNFVCSKCDHEERLPIQISINFFWPS